MRQAGPEPATVMAPRGRAGTTRASTAPGFVPPCIRHGERECRPSPLRWSTGADTNAGRVVSVDEVARLRDNRPAWRLLRADNAPLGLRLLHQAFLTPNAPSTPPAAAADRVHEA